MINIPASLSLSFCPGQSILSMFFINPKIIFFESDRRERGVMVWVKFAIGESSVHKVPFRSNQTSVSCTLNVVTGVLLANAGSTMLTKSMLKTIQQCITWDSQFPCKTSH